VLSVLGYLGIGKVIEDWVESAPVLWWMCILDGDHVNVYIEGLKCQIATKFDSEQNQDPYCN